MPFSIIKGDITRMKADAIVNAANEHLARGGGVCGAIFAAAGADRLQEACWELGRCPTGSAVITPGFDLPARFVIHTVGPVWQGGGRGEEALLRSAYRSSLELAVKEGCQSIAFPAISSGIYGYPLADALRCAVEEIEAFLKDHDLQVWLVLFGGAAVETAKELWPALWQNG